MTLLNYQYTKTDSKNVKPKGEGWEFWGMKNTPDESIAVWRREEGKYDDGFFDEMDD